MQEHFLRSIYRTGGIYRQELLDVALCNDKVNEGT